MSAESRSAAAALAAARRRERARAARRALGLADRRVSRRAARWLHDIRPRTPSDIRLLVPACVAWATVALLLGSPGWVLGLAALLSVLLALVAARRRRVMRAAAVASMTGLVVALCLGVLAGHRALRTAGSLDDLAAARAMARVNAEVVSDPRTVGGGAERAAKVMVRLHVLQVQGRGASSRVSAPVLVFGDPGWSRLRWGQRVEVTGRLSAAEPGDDVVAVLQPRATVRVVGEPSVVVRAAERIREGLRAAVSGLPPDAAGLLPGLVIGDTSLTPPDLSSDMTLVQMSHLSAVSGSNVSVVLAAVLGLCGLLGVPRRARPVVALTGLAGFVVLARPEPSVVRAAAMGAVGVVGISADRRRAAFPALAAALVGLLCYDPWLARSMGFALSTLATLGLLLFATPWGEAVGLRLPRRIRGWGPALAIPVAAQVMCAPVTVMLQPTLSLVGVPANLLAEPLVGPTTVLGIVTALAAVVSVPVAHVVAWVAGVPAWLIARIARVAAALPYGSVPWLSGGSGALLLAVLSVALVLAGPRLRWWGRTRPLLAASVVLLLAALLVPTRSTAWPVPGWTLVMCDVGQGDGLVLSSGPGRAVVVDVGPERSGITDCLGRLGIRRLDAIVLTHYHDDHVGGLERVLDGWPVDRLLVTRTREPEAQARRVDTLAARHHLSPVVLRGGDQVHLGDVQAQVLGPRRDIHEGSVPNNASLVLLAETRGTRVLLTGDMEPESGADVLEVLRRGPPRAIDVLKVAHHGSAKQEPQLLAYLHARLALISVGADNDYGQPAPSALTRLREDGCRVERTDESGDLAVLGHGGSLEVARRGR